MARDRSSRDRYPDRHGDEVYQQTLVNARIVDRGELKIAGAIAVTDAQQACVARHGWALTDIPAAPERYAKHVDLAYVVRVPAGNVYGLYLYASDAWHAAGADAPPDPAGACLVWDARPGADRDDGDHAHVPVCITGDDGGVLSLRAMSDGPVFDWPLEHGDRIFIEYTDTRLRQMSLLEVEAAEAVNPERFARLLKRYGTREVMRKRSEDWQVRHSVPDLARATEALVTDLRRQQAVFDKIRPSAERMLDTLLSATGGGTAGEAVAAPTSGLSDAEIEQYTYVAYALVRGDVAHGGTLAAELGIVPGGVRARPGRAPFMVKTRGHVDQLGGHLDRHAWCRMRAHHDYVTQYDAVYTNVDMPEYKLHCRMEWFGLEIMLAPADDDAVEGATTHKPPSAVPHMYDIGYAVLVRYERADDGIKYPWLMYRHFPRDTPDTELESFYDNTLGGPSEPGRAGNARMDAFAGECLRMMGRFLGMDPMEVSAAGGRARAKGQA